VTVFCFDFTSQSDALKLINVENETTILYLAVIFIKTLIRNPVKSKKMALSYIFAGLDGNNPSF